MNIVYIISIVLVVGIGIAWIVAFAQSKSDKRPKNEYNKHVRK